MDLEYDDYRLFSISIPIYELEKPRTNKTSVLRVRDTVMLVLVTSMDHLILIKQPCPFYLPWKKKAASYYVRGTK